jgi:predicted dinucleotide-binding enzyme
MKIGILGTGSVGQTIGKRLLTLGHEVKLGARDARNEKAAAFAAASPNASAGTFADAAAFGELVFNCTLGAATLEAIAAAGPANLRGKILVDVSNPLDFSKGMPPSLFAGNTDSLAERIQQAVPEARVVKALNTVNADIMVNPGALADGDHDTFVSGNDADAKRQVSALLASFGWRRIVDLGDLSTARGTESYLPLWIRLWGALGSATFNIKIVR